MRGWQCKCSTVNVGTLVCRGCGATMKRHKHGAIRTTIDGIKFPSKLEAGRYAELKQLQTIGHISRLALQVPYPINVFVRQDAGRVGYKEVGNYLADFEYTDNAGRVIVEDTKGFDTPMSRFKRKCVEAQYGITIHIIRGRYAKRTGQHKRKQRTAGSRGSQAKKATQGGDAKAST